MTSLVEHARRELERLGEEPRMVGCLLATIGAYASFGHSGGSHAEALDMLVRLLRREALTPLTADPAEWIDRSEMSGVPLWQNERDSRAFSEDGGRTYWLSGVVGEPGEVAYHQSVAPPGWVRALRERDRLRQDEAVAAVRAYLDAGPIERTDQLALDIQDERGRTRYMVERWGRQGAAVAALLYQPTPVDRALPEPVAA